MPWRARPLEYHFHPPGPRLALASDHDYFVTTAVLPKPSLAFPFRVSRQDLASLSPAGSSGWTTGCTSSLPNYPFTKTLRRP